MRPVICVECAAPMWIVGAHSWPEGRWEVGLVCPDPACPGWAVYGSAGKMGTHRSKRLNPSLSRAQDAVQRAIKYKQATGARQDTPQADTWAARARSAAGD